MLDAIEAEERDPASTRFKTVSEVAEELGAGQVASVNRALETQSEYLRGKRRHSLHTSVCACFFGNWI